MKMLATVTTIAAMIWLSLFSTTAGAQAPASKKLAFLVGVSDYKRDGLANLNYSDDDIEALSVVLEKQLGFEVDVLLREQATLANIKRRFAAFIRRTKEELAKDDIVFVAFSGHGLQKDVMRDSVLVTEAYFCPYDASKFDNTTLLPINEVMKSLETESSSSQNLLVIDACRDDPTKAPRGSTAARPKNCLPS